MPVRSPSAAAPGSRENPGPVGCGVGRSAAMWFGFE
jgi:hypothetical protein